jgi:hypothetical protein
MNRFGQLAVSLAGLALATAMAAANDYAVDWYSVDGGAGTSAGGAYAVSGIIGQPDAGVLSGGAYTVAGGFWAVGEAFTQPPVLSVSHDPERGAIILSWPVSAIQYLLEETSTLGGAMRFGSQCRRSPLSSEPWCMCRCPSGRPEPFSD